MMGYNNVTTTTLVYQCPFKTAQAKVDNMPKVVLHALKQHLLNNSGATWLGGRDFGNDIKDEFKYIYFSEPDLILHTRAKALSLMVQQLDQVQSVDCSSISATSTSDRLFHLPWSRPDARQL